MVSNGTPPGELNTRRSSSRWHNAKGRQGILCYYPGTTSLGSWQGAIVLLATCLLMSTVWKCRCFAHASRRAGGFVAL